MSRDIYDQFRAAEEALRAQREADAQRKIREEEERVRLAFEARSQRESAERQEREIEAQRIAEARARMDPVKTALVDILTAIKDNDPRVKNEKSKGVYVGEEVINNAGTLEMRYTVALAAGNVVSSTLITQHESSGEAYGSMPEDFTLIFVTVDLTDITVHSGSPDSKVNVNNFQSNNAVIMEPLAKAVAKPIRRFLTFGTERVGWFRDGFIFRSRSYGTPAKPRDINGRTYDWTRVSSGKRSFWNNTTSDSGDSY